MNVDCARHGKSLQMILPGISTSHAQRWTRTLGPDVSRWLTSRHCRFHQSLTPQAIIEMSQWLSHCLACNRGQIRRETEPRSRAWSEKKKNNYSIFPWLLEIPTCSRTVPSSGEGSWGQGVQDEICSVFKGILDKGFFPNTSGKNQNPGVKNRSKSQAPVQPQVSCVPLGKSPYTFRP